jgi:signal peptidase I
MYTDFSSLLAIATVLTGLLVLFDRSCLKRRRGGRWLRVVMEQAHSFFPALLVVCLVRGFMVEPFRIPSGSMKPTLVEGDFILVNKYIYGWRLPALGWEIKKRGDPQRGDILVFRYPKNVNVDFIKRVVAVPGDRVAYKNNRLVINGQILPLSEPAFRYDHNGSGQVWPVKQSFEEWEPGKKHAIYQREGHGYDMEEQVVPQGYYFAMGDNRNNSGDSREWGLVPRDYVIGKAFYIWMSWDMLEHHVRWNRLGGVT